MEVCSYKQGICVGLIVKVNLSRLTGRKWTCIGRAFQASAKALR